MTPELCRRHPCPTPTSAYTGEILPQAVCSRYGLMIGAYSAWFVIALIWVCSPIAWPISLLLDRLLGTERSVRELSARAHLGRASVMIGQQKGKKRHTQKKGLER